MTISISASDGIRADRSIRHVTDWAARRLGLAASPAFALMAWITAGDTAQAAICSVGASPLHGMAWMYALMGILHLGPWLGLASNRMRNSLEVTTQAKGN